MKTYEPQDDDDHSPQAIEPPTEADVDRIARLIILAKREIRKVVGKKLIGKREDLAPINEFFEKGGQISPEVSTAFGVAFGNILVSEERDYDWWIAVYGNSREAVVRFRKTALLFHTESFFLKRLEDGQPIHVSELYEEVVSRMRALSQKVLLTN